MEHLSYVPPLRRGVSGEALRHGFQPTSLDNKGQITLVTDE